MGGGAPVPATAAVDEVEGAGGVAPAEEEELGPPGGCLEEGPDVEEEVWLEGPGTEPMSAGVGKSEPDLRRSRKKYGH